MRCFDGHPMKKVSHRIKTTVRLWKLSSNAHNQGSQQTLPWEHVAPRYKIWSEYNAYTSNASDEMRYKVIKFMHIGVKLLYDHGRKSDQDAVK